jgi:hypothetical protein
MICLSVVSSDVDVKGGIKNFGIYCAFDSACSKALFGRLL